MVGPGLGEMERTHPGDGVGYLPVFPRWFSDKESTCPGKRRKRRGVDLWVGKIPWKREWQPTLASCLENFMDRGAWRATVHGVAKSRIQMSTATRAGCF